MAQLELFKVITELFVFIFSTIDINHISIMKEEWEWHNYILLYDNSKTPETSKNETKFNSKIAEGKKKKKRNELTEFKHEQSSRCKKENTESRSRT